ncbi:hypothetical protein J2Z83_002748 [Virgibacillus natechei]|uniref:YfkD-like protein n=1 Tax=Virgibacillus natechei TaxID=1216297 RepID=A0ABS4II41_9BACI|nr:YfkD famly protein [Virgibacillus natechei]MBP1970612.1 hypothetical protein [Virgibacillus natechei]UZD13997.1 YfkD family protein [Virgibacillus natechei]
MKYKRSYVIVLIVFVYAFLSPLTVLGEEEEEEKGGEFEPPNHVLTISKENTFPNSSEDQEVIEPSELTQELIDEMDIPIENPDLIKMLNETSLNPSPISFGYRGEVYLGRWALNYESLETTVNWEYQDINKNELNNLGGENDQEMNYVQQEDKEVKGALTNKITDPEEVKKMMLLTTEAKTELPLTYETVIGKNTKKNNSYNVPVEKYAELNAHAPAVSEKGEVTFGEVYIELKGSNKSIVIKNVTNQGIGAWIPVEDHISFSFQLE